MAVLTALLLTAPFMIRAGEQAPQNPHCAFAIDSAFDPDIGPPSPEVLVQLAPSGTLRVAVHQSNPNIGGMQGTTMVGTAVDMACRLAARLNLPMELMPKANALVSNEDFQRNGFDIGWAADSTLTSIQNAAIANAYIGIENTYLVPKASPYQSVNELDLPGIRIGVQRGNSTDNFLTAQLRHATLVRFNSNPESFSALKAGQLDAAAAGRSPIVQFANVNWGGQGRALPDNLFTAYAAPFIHLGKPEALCYLSQFVEAAKVSGLVAEAIRRSGAHSSIVGRVEAPPGKVCKPTARCQDVEIAADAACRASPPVDAGSRAVDGRAALCVQDPPPPYALGSRVVELRCIDPTLPSFESACTSHVNVVDRTPPDVSLRSPAGNYSSTLWPPNGRWHTLALPACVASVTDACDGALPIAGTVRRATADEGSPADLLLIQPDFLAVRSLRDGHGDGRVYRWSADIADRSGNAAVIHCAAQVPHDQSGLGAVDSGVRVCVGGGCN